MKIDHLIKQLQKITEDHGNIEVVVDDEDGAHVDLDLRIVIRKNRAPVVEINQGQDL